jgi:isopentenyl-diphosphate delta-isomerase
MTKPFAKRHSADQREPASAIEIVDGGNRLLGAFTTDITHRQGLYHRAVVVLAYGPGQALYLRKRLEKATPPHTRVSWPGRWDFPAAGHVRRGEAAEEAALRRMYETCGLRLNRLRLRETLPPSRHEVNEFLSLYSAGVLDSEAFERTPDPERGMLVDPDELAYLADQFREMLTPRLTRFWELGLLYPTGL